MKKFFTSFLSAWVSLLALHSFTLLADNDVANQILAPNLFGKAIYGNTNKVKHEGVRYFGSVIELKGKKEKRYRELHANVWEDVLAAIAKANIHNYHIYLAELGGKKYLFSHFEYTGNNMRADFDIMAADKTTREKWWPITDNCQERIPGTPEGLQWMPLESLMQIQ